MCRESAIFPSVLLSILLSILLKISPAPIQDFNNEMIVVYRQAMAHIRSALTVARLIRLPSPLSMIESKIKSKIKNWSEPFLEN